MKVHDMNTHIYIMNHYEYMWTRVDKQLGIEVLLCSCLKAAL